MSSYEGLCPCCGCIECEKPLAESAATVEGGSLVRYGRAPAGSILLLHPMADGYWTPWHVAAAEVAALRAQLSELRRWIDEGCEGDSPSLASS